MNEVNYIYTGVNVQYKNMRVKSNDAITTAAIEIYVNIMVVDEIM